MAVVKFCVVRDSLSVNRAVCAITAAGIKGTHDHSKTFEFIRPETLFCDSLPRVNIQAPLRYSCMRLQSWYCATTQDPTPSMNHAAAAQAAVPA